MLTEWIAALDGKPVRQQSFAQRQSIGLGHHSFSGLPDYVAAPEIGHHYISVTLGAPLEVEGILSGGRMTGEVRRGQIIIMAAHQANTWRWSAPTEEAHVFLDPLLLAEVAEEAGSSSPELLNRCAIDDGLLAHLVLTLTRDLESQDASSRLMLECGARFLAHHLLNSHCAQKSLAAPRRPGLSAAQIRKLEDFAAERLGADIGLVDLAGVVGLSPFHFARSFRLATGETPNGWLTRKRMERARHLIETTALPIIEVSAQVGFESQSHFGQLFRKWAGLTPTDLRRQTRG